MIIEFTEKPTNFSKMFALTGILLLTILFCGTNADEHTKIVGGADAEDGAFPHQVSLRYKNRHFCGGSILNENWVLTAAHCVDSGRVDGVTVVAGTNTLDAGGHVYEVEKLIEHEKWSSSEILNDIALIKVKTPIKFSEKVKKIDLPKEDTEAGEDLVLSGWGTTTVSLFPFWNIYPGKAPNKLQTIKLKSIGIEKCKEMHPTFKVVPTQICTLTKTGEGACHGDSGGPLVHQNVQVGVVSWGKPCAKGKPDVFTRVYSYLDWINEHMKD